MLAALALLVQSVALPPHSTVLGAPDAGFRLPACSRPTAGPVEGGWDPGNFEIAAMEAALSKQLKSLAGKDGYDENGTDPDPLTYDPADTRWQREYFGIMRGGHYILYGNYLPAGIVVNEKHLPTEVCDGGPVFFGVEYDLTDRRITHIAFNGALGGPFWPAYKGE